MPDLDAADPRPWESPGAVRKDVTPHRGEALLLLGRVALVSAACSFCLPPAVLVAFPLAFVADMLAYRDLQRMEAGAMDPTGRVPAEQARSLSWWAIALGMTGLLVSGLLLVVVATRENR